MINKDNKPSRIVFFSSQIFSFLYVIIRFFISNLYGVSFLLLFIYFFGHYLGLERAYSFKELINWTIDLPHDYKISLFTSTITVIGFLIAFQAGTTNIRNQLLSETKLKAADELWEFYKHLKRLIIKSNIFSKMILEIFELVENQEESNKIQFKIDYLYSQYDEFMEIRKQITELSPEIFVYREKFYLIIVNIFKGLRYLDLANELFSNVANKIWATFPHKIDKGISIEFFLKHTNKDEFVELNIACKKADLIDMYIGYIKGYLLSNFVRPNIVSIYSTIKEFKIIKNIRLGE